MHFWIIIVLIIFPYSAQSEDLKPLLTPGQALFGKFIQERHMEGFNAPVISEGQFIVVPSKGLIWRTEKPFETVMIISRQGIIQTIAGQETLRLPSSRFPALNTLQEIFETSLTGNWSVVEQQFGVKPIYEGDKWTLDIGPNQSQDQLPIKRIEMAGSAFVDLIQIERFEGDYDLISFYDQQAKPISELTPNESLLLKGYQ